MDLFLTILLHLLPYLFWAGLLIYLLYREPRRLRVGVVLLILLMLLVGDVVRLLVPEPSLNDQGFLTFDDPSVRLFFFGGIAIAVSIMILGGYLVANSLEMFRKEGRSVMALFSGIIGAGILAYLVIAVIAIYTSQLTLTLWLILLALPISVVAFLFVSYLLYARLYDWYFKRYGKPAAAVIVLGMGLLNGERISPLLASRLDLGLRQYYKAADAGQDPVMLTSGGQGPDEKLPEAEAMGKYLLQQGLDPEDLIQETQSRTTEENLQFSATLLPEKANPVVVVTNNFHAFRAATLMEETNLPGYAVGSRTASYFLPSATIREFMAMLRDRLVSSIILIGLSLLPFLGFLFSSLLG